MNQAEANRKAKDLVARMVAQYVQSIQVDTSHADDYLDRLGPGDRARVITGLERVARDLRWGGQRQYESMRSQQMVSRS